MNDNDLLFEQIKEKYCNGSSGFGWNGVSNPNEFSLLRNNHQIKVTKLKVEDVNIHYSKDKVSTLEMSGTVKVSELDATIEAWAAEYEPTAA